MLWMIITLFWPIVFRSEAGDALKGALVTLAMIDAFIEVMGITYFIYTFIMV